MSGLDSIYRILDGIVRRLVTLRTGTVSGSTATTAVITIGGGSVSNVPFLASYTPTVGDNVIVLQTVNQLLIIGKAK